MSQEYACVSFLQHAALFCSTWMMSCVHFENKEVIKDWYFSDRIFFTYLLLNKKTVLLYYFFISHTCRCINVNINKKPVYISIVIFYGNQGSSLNLLACHHTSYVVNYLYLRNQFAWNTNSLAIRISLILIM